MKPESWTKAVDGTTVFWLGFFIVGFMAFDTDVFCFEESSDILPESLIEVFEPYCVKEPLINIPENYKLPWQIFSWIIWGIFAVDVYYKYRNSENLKMFFKKHWLDIVLLIPFFRIFRIMRLLRLLKILKFAKVGTSLYKAIRKFKRFEKTDDKKEKNQDE